MKYLYISLVICLLLIIGCGPSPETLATQTAATATAIAAAWTATLTPTATSTFTPTPTQTLTPTPLPTDTPTPVPPTATPTPTSTPTHTPTFTPVPPTATPTPLPGPKAGHWEGEPSVSFDVTSNGNIHNFSITVPFGGTSGTDTCTFTLEEIAIEPGGTFIYSTLIAADKFLNKEDLDFAVAMGIGPEIIKTDSGDMIETHHISGKFDNATTLKGSSKILKCEDRIYLTSEKEGNPWGAEWRKP